MRIRAAFPVRVALPPRPMPHEAPLNCVIGDARPRRVIASGGAGRAFGEVDRRGSDRSDGCEKPRGRTREPFTGRSTDGSPPAAGPPPACPPHPRRRSCGGRTSHREMRDRAAFPVRIARSQRPMLHEAPLNYVIGGCGVMAASARDRERRRWGRFGRGGSERIGRMREAPVDGLGIHSRGFDGWMPLPKKFRYTARARPAVRLGGRQTGMDADRFQAAAPAGRVKCTVWLGASVHRRPPCASAMARATGSAGTA